MARMDGYGGSVFIRSIRVKSLLEAAAFGFGFFACGGRQRIFPWKGSCVAAGEAVNDIPPFLRFLRLDAAPGFGYTD